MPQQTITTFDGDGNVVETETVEIPEDEQETADRTFRQAVEAAGTLEELKAAILAAAETR